FQAEDGIRDPLVTGVQTCALPICERGAAIVHSNTSVVLAGQPVAEGAGAAHLVHVREIYTGAGGPLTAALWPLWRRQLLNAGARSEERRVGKGDRRGRSAAQ